MWTTFWWIVDDENSEMCGEQFFTELKDAKKLQHWNYVKELFPDTEIRCLGQVNEEQAEALGLDTY